MSASPTVFEQMKVALGNGKEFLHGRFIEEGCEALK